jgi:hypothetical protein
MMTPGTTCVTPKCWGLCILRHDDAKYNKCDTEVLGVGAPAATRALLVDPSAAAAGLPVQLLAQLPALRPGSCTAVDI